MDYPTWRLASLEVRQRYWAAYPEELRRLVERITRRGSEGPESAALAAKAELQTLLKEVQYAITHMALDGLWRDFLSHHIQLYDEHVEKLLGKWKQESPWRAWGASNQFLWNGTDWNEDVADEL